MLIYPYFCSKKATNPMPATNPIVTTDTEQFVVGDSDLRYFYNYPARCECGAIILCRSDG